MSKKKILKKLYSNKINTFMMIKSENLLFSINVKIRKGIIIVGVNKYSA